MRKVIGQQGEVNVSLIGAVPPNAVTTTLERDSAGRIIVSHSEKGHHHVLGADVDVLARPNAPAGMQIIYAIVKDPTSLSQTAAAAHDEIALEPGFYEIRIAREYNPFADEARRVAD